MPRAAFWLRAVIAAMFVAGVAAQTPSGNADLDRVRDEIRKLRGSLDRVRSQARSTEEQLQMIELELAINEREVILAHDAHDRLRGDEERLTVRVSDLETRMARDRKLLARRVALLYRFGALGYLRMALSFDQRRNPFEAAAMLAYIVGRDARTVNQVQLTRETLRVQLAELAAKRARIEQVRQVVEDRQRAAARARGEKERLLTKLRTEGASSARRLAELEEKASRLERLFSLLYGRNDPARLAGTRITEFRGALDWPVRGAIVESFGPQRNPKFSTVTVSNGYKIAAGAGADIRSVFQGTVLYSQWFKGYGNLVIVDHGNRVFSLYGNTQNARVGVGDRVTLGQVIASVGTAEVGESSYLYFEIREDNKPSDPGKWLR